MTVLLQDRTQWAVRRLLAAEPEVGSLLPDTALRAIEHLVGCDIFGIGETDRTGCLLRDLTFPWTDWEIRRSVTAHRRPGCPMTRRRPMASAKLRCGECGT